jgi:NADH dehydrogenase
MEIFFAVTRNILADVRSGIEGKTTGIHTGTRPYHVVIVGGGFGGLYAAKSLNRSGIKVTLIDRRNFHLFQPLLYQVATGELSPGDIASPLRAIFSRQKNTRVIKDEAVDIWPDNKILIARNAKIPFDSLIVATGSTHHYFGHDSWIELAPGLKTIEDALEMRRRIFQKYEQAEMESVPEKRKALLTFVVIGGGPAGVELAGALGDLAYRTMKDDFRNLNTGEVRILLIEGADRLLPTYPPRLSANAEKALKKLGIAIHTDARVIDIQENRVRFTEDDSEQQIDAHTILWAAGVKSSPLGQVIAEKTKAEVDRTGRILVAPDLSIPGHPNIFVIGDLANFSHQGGKPLPGVASVAMQQGKYVARLIRQRIRGKRIKPFRYRNRGSLAVIGRNMAVADFSPLKLSGFLAWLIWVFIHIAYLIEFDNKLIVLIQWGWNYLTHRRGARLITGDTQD